MVIEWRHGFQPVNCNPVSVVSSVPRLLQIRDCQTFMPGDDEADWLAAGQINQHRVSSSFEAAPTRCWLEAARSGKGVGAVEYKDGACAGDRTTGRRAAAGRAYTERLILALVSSPLKSDGHIDARTPRGNRIKQLRGAGVEEQGVYH